MVNQYRSLQERIKRFRNIYEDGKEFAALSLCRRFAGDGVIRGPEANEASRGPQLNYQFLERLAFHLGYVFGYEGKRRQIVRDLRA